MGRALLTVAGLALVVLAPLLFPSCLWSEGDWVTCRLRTSAGEIQFRVYPKKAPLTAANFLRYVDAGLYNGTTFFRVVTPENQPDNKVKIEVIQGGDVPENRCFAPVAHETTATTGLRHGDGTVSMARNGPGTATSSFFICVGRQPELDFGGQRNPDGQGFAAFGRVVAGLDVVRRIQRLEADGQTLKAPVVIDSLTRLAGPPAALSTPPALQWLVVVTAFFVKPLYMCLSLLLAWFLRRRREADLSALKWAMVFFFAGELFCAVNYVLFGEGSLVAEYLHMSGMALAFFFTLLAVSEFMDRRVIHFSAAGKNCALLAACGKCYKTAPVACSLRLVFVIVLPCLALLCAMPLLVPLRFAAQGTVILGTPYTYAHPALYQFFETRVSPLAAALFFTAALLAFLLRRERAWAMGKLCFAAGAGFLSFSLFRLVLFSLFRENLYWFVIWEEWTEMMFIAALWLSILIFRKKPLLASPQL